MDLSAHALRLFNLTDDVFVILTLGDRRRDRDLLAEVCTTCENLPWG